MSSPRLINSRGQALKRGQDRTSMLDDRDAAGVLTALGLTIDATDQEIEAVAVRLDPEAPGDAVEAIRVIIEAVRAEATS